MCTSEIILIALQIMKKTVITPNGRLRQETGNAPDRGTSFNSSY